MKRNATESALSPAALVGAGLEATGASREEIAAKTGVSPVTVHRWRKRPDYRAEVKRLRSEGLDAIQADMLSARRTMLTGLKQAAENALAMLTKHPADPDINRHQGRLLLDAWRSLAAQTGITETTRAEVEVTAPEEVRRLLRQDIDSLTDEELDALRARKAT